MYLQNPGRSLRTNCKSNIYRPTIIKIDSSYMHKAVKDITGMSNLIMLQLACPEHAALRRFKE